ncbi:MAG: hypothetical protein JOY68_04840 [Candidatus Dormibacteraeota bacterium]|nr:hypothetical protein [Candidatus Dormibacteraeota bacterium]MBV8444676.1 hypothetical protein [Candidatus Dormibacteraeota bacterium]
MRPFSWLAAFALFWWDFIIGDDWRMAAAVIAGLGLTALALHWGLQAWWLLPAVVVVAIAFHLWRVSGARR